MLAVPLTQAHVNTACQFHESLKQWKLSDAALIRLREAVPGFDAEACLLKSIAVNSLYGTQVLAIVRMADHIKKTMAQTLPALVGPELVKAIAALPVSEGETPRRSVSFAAKFCHFFVDEERFPIYDEAARNAIKLHLGPSAVAAEGSNPYQAYCQNLELLRSEAGLNGPGRHLDRYLWIVGMYIKWLTVRRKAKQPMNVELRTLFETPSREVAIALDALLPSTLDRAFYDGS